MGEHITRLQEDNERRKVEQDKSIAREREKRYKEQLEYENQEEEDAARAAVLQKTRRIAAENKDRAHEEAEEEDLRQLRIRWREVDAEKARHIAEARARKERNVAAQAEKKKADEEAARATQAKLRQLGQAARVV